MIACVHDFWPLGAGQQWLQHNTFEDGLFNSSKHDNASNRLIKRLFDYCKFREGYLRYFIFLFHKTKTS